MVVGTFSSIFIATPFLAQLKERQPEMQALTRRVVSRRAKEGSSESGTKAEDLRVNQPHSSSIVKQAGPRRQTVKKPRSARKSR
jgi:preprotein translocase subunit SecF